MGRAKYRNAGSRHDNDTVTATQHTMQDRPRCELCHCQVTHAHAHGHKQLSPELNKRISIQRRSEPAGHVSTENPRSLLQRITSKPYCWPAGSRRASWTSPGHIAMTAVQPMLGQVQATLHAYHLRLKRSYARCGCFA